MPSPIYQARENIKQIAALKALSDETRLLIDNIIESAASIEDLQQATRALQQVNNNLQPLRCNDHQSRPLKHFHFADAQSQAQEILPYSPISGQFNPIAPPAHIHFDAELNKAFATVTCTRAYEGPPSMVHGAIIAGIYDQVLAIAATCYGKIGPTAYLNTQFLQPTLLHQELVFSAWVEHCQGRKVFIKGQCEINGQIVSTADALCIEHKA